MMLTPLRRRLTKGRKKRPVPGGWASSDEISSYEQTTVSALPVPQASSIALENDYAAVSGLHGNVAIYSVAADKVERSLDVGQPVTYTIWTGARVIVSTYNAAVKVYESGTEVQSFTQHAGAVTGLALHPGGELFASVGIDKSFIFYDQSSMSHVMRVFTDSCSYPSPHILPLTDSSVLP